MRIFRSLDEVPSDFGPSALTIGNFDGVHAAHRSILRHVKEVAEERGLKASALTFNPHPTKVVSPARAPRLMTAPEQRAALMESTGIDQVLIMPFNQELAHLTPEQFVEQVLVKKLGVRAVVLGHDFCFGYKQAGNVRVLEKLGEKYGFTTEEVKAVKVRGRVASSTALRQLIDAGFVAQAARMLERPYVLEGAGGRGPRRGIAADRADAELGAGYGGASGKRRLYDAHARFTMTDARWQSITNVGYRPTFGDSQRTVDRDISAGAAHRVNAERNPR